jgi:hypothetical protein
MQPACSHCSMSPAMVTSAWCKRPERRRSCENRIFEDKLQVFHAANHGIYKTFDTLQMTADQHKP